MELARTFELDEMFGSGDVIEQRFPCKAEGCTVAFKNELLRIQHARHIHPELLLYKCDICGVRCETKGALERHLKNKHKPKASVQSKPVPSLISPKQQTIPQPITPPKIEQLERKIERNKSRAKVEMACVRYAQIHGKHKAQLCYAQLHPEYKIGWRRITDLIQKQKTTSNSGLPLYKKLHHRSDQLKFHPIPKAIKEACGEYAVFHGSDDSQWEFTLKYPNYVFSYASVAVWCKAAKMRLEKNPPIEFDKDFVSLLNDMLSVERELTVAEASQIIKYHVEANNKDENNPKINYEDAEAEWFHAMNFNAFNKKKFSCPCGSVYKTEAQLNKHKPKCWIPEVKQDATGRSQRSCRLKPAPGECETLSESDSERNTLDKTEIIYNCKDCGFSTNNKAGLTRHNKVCDRGERLYSTKPTSSVTYGPSSAQLLSFKSCRYCSFKHITIEGLREHYRVVHDTHYTDSGQEVSLSCPTCRETFLTYAGLREHICNERLITVTYEPIKPRVSMAITLGDSSSIVYICPRCVTRFETITDLQTHYNAKSCIKT